jgi:dTDP-L-rhamnose 4-epimerase
MKASGIERVLVIGGAGFIGSHTVDHLCNIGYEVKVLDNLDPQVHGHSGLKPIFVNNNAEFFLGNLTRREVLKEAINNIDAIIHLGAAVGVGQSMYEVEHYIDINTRGTACLLDVLINDKNNVKKLIIASSMSVYGEGSYKCYKCNEIIYPELRNENNLRKKIWDPLCPYCGKLLDTIATK